MLLGSVAFCTGRCAASFQLPILSAIALDPLAATRITNQNFAAALGFPESRAPEQISFRDVHQMWWDVQNAAVRWAKTEKESDGTKVWPVCCCLLERVFAVVNGFGAFSFSTAVLVDGTMDRGRRNAGQESRC